MRILILGVTGMLGHKVMQVLSKNNFSVTGTIRGNYSIYIKNLVLSRMEIIENVNAEDITGIENTVNAIRPEAIINCIGIVKQVESAKNPIKSITMNALFPHKLAEICEKRNIRLIHMSTDCVFSGKKGNYSENDFADAEDLYGRTKYLGEVGYGNCVTIRTSIIGRELDTSHGLIEWFIGQDGKKVLGFKRTIFSGVTTIVLSEIISKILLDYPDLKGVWQIASEPISKFELLNIVKKQYNLSIEIEPDEREICDRSLNASKFKERTNIQIPSWEKMVEQMYLDHTPYTQLRKMHAHQ